MSLDKTRVVNREPDGQPDEAPPRPDPAAETLVQPRPPQGIQPGTLLANTYRVERLLGGGGMGEVYLTRHAGLGTAHAVKVIRPAMALDPMVMDLFYREARVLRGVRHDAVVSYDGFVRDEQGRDYLVMEYVEGPSLAERLRRGPLSAPQVLALRNRLAAGLGEAHRKGAVHRDLSPDNVVLPEERIELAKLIDFGVCKLTDPAQGTILGSSFAGKYRYASPEQLGLYGGNTDARADIYSLGLVLAAAALGRPLPMGDSLEGTLKARQGVPDLAGVPAELRPWLEAMLQPDPQDRPESLEALLAFWPAGGRSGTASGIPSGTPAGPGAAKRSGTPEVGSPRGLGRLGWGIGAILMLGLGGGLYWQLRPLPVAIPRPDPQASTPGPGTAAPDRPPTQTPERPSDRPPTRASDPIPDPTRNSTGAADSADLPGLLRSGRLDSAFALVQTELAAGRPPPRDQTWALTQALLAAGRLDPGFALTRELANGGFGPAAFALAEMYDPLHWSKERSPFGKPNGEKARDWYGRAAELGVAQAQGRLKALEEAGAP